MLARFSILFLFFTLAFAGSVLQVRVDHRAQVEIPEEDTLDTLCTAWNNECTELAQNDGTPGGECVKGYAGPGTATVLCYAQTSNTTAVNFTPQVIAELNLQPAQES